MAQKLARLSGSLDNVESSLYVQYHIPRKLVEEVLLLLYIRKFANFNLARAQTIMTFPVIFLNPSRQTSGQCLREATKAPSSLSSSKFTVI
jgi:hypothetical protein